MQEIGYNLSGYAKKILLCLVGVVFLFLAWDSMGFTCYTGEDYAGKILTEADKRVWNLLVLGAVLLVAYGLWRLQESSVAEKIWKCCVPIACVATVWISLWWAFASNTTPEGDQLIVSAAAVYAGQGDFSMLSWGGYLFYYPQQLGLMGFLEIVFGVFGEYRYDVVYVIFALMNGGTVLFGSLFLRKIQAPCSTRILYTILMPLCLPYLLFTPYVYGDVPTIFFCVGLFWATAMWEKDGKYGYLILMCVMAALAVLFRKNSIIVVCGVVIGLVLMALAQKRLRHLVAIVAIVLAVIGSVQGVEAIYEQRSGYQVEAGMPAMLYLSMGMQDTDIGPGRYNNYTKEVFQSVELDRNMANEIARDDIRARWQELCEKPERLWEFYREKILTQWNDPLFASLVSNHVFAEEPEGLAAKIYQGEAHDYLKAFCNRYQFLIYSGCLLAILVLWKEKECAWSVPLIVILGGFLFSVIWEAQGRYVLPYYVFAVIYGAYGLTVGGGALINRICEWLRRRLNGDKH
uniref:hypothetical protein n=1 Tax=Acetatifactor sp. TaxID=1872090 RepID=UPI00405601C9